MTSYKRVRSIHSNDNPLFPHKRKFARSLSAILLSLALLLTGLCSMAFAEELSAEDTAGEQYTLDKVVVLSRHNIRSPMSGSGSLLSDITPHAWFQWTSNPSELSVRGGVLEAIMGQYFRKWLEDEGLFPENYQPEDGEVRFYSNAK